MAPGLHIVVFILSLASVCQVQSRLDKRDENENNNNNDGGLYCPDGTQCKTGDTTQTCCQIGDTRYGCCFLPNAVCCADRAHCCPEKSVCDLKRQRCVPEMLLKQKAHYSQSSMGESTPIHKEFDKLMYLIYNRYDSSLTQNKGCPGCRLPNAVCCSDGLHCCPQHMNCGPNGDTCVEKEDLTNTVLLTETAAETIVPDYSLPWSEIKTEKSNEVCPGGKMSCKANDTCCQAPKGTYACCPLPKATCCNDGLHCCPQGSKCDLVHKRCVNEDEATLVSFESDPVETNVCPDKKTQCPDGTTCCQTPSGYGCCPFDKATCCSDKLHCCPHGFRCNLSTETCVKGDISFQSGRILPGIRKDRSVVCPGGHFKCPDNTTCCELPDGHFGCCPYPRAVCCSDKQHCCPESTKCDIPHQRCVQQWFSIPFAQVLLAEKRED